MDQNAILEVRNLSVTIGECTILSDISFDVLKGKRVGIAGPSGSGKTMLAWTIVSGQPAEASVEGKITYCSNSSGNELLGLNSKNLSSLLGSEIAIIPQNPYSSLNPSRTCGDQVREAIKDKTLSHSAVMDLSITALQDMGFVNPQRISDAYPHQLSGGQLQRVVIAMAIINTPSLLIADEPTTALDTVTTRHILGLLDNWVKQKGASLVLVSHDWTVLSLMCNEIVSLKAGEVISINDVSTIDISDKILHGNKQQAVETDMGNTDAAPVLVIEKLTKTYTSSGKRVQKVVGVKDLSLEIAPGESFGLVGESGSGKSTLAKLLTGLEIAEEGTMTFDQHKIDYLENPFLRKEIQMIFQDPYSALYPHRTVGYCIEEPLKLHHNMKVDERKSKALELMQLVDLDKAYYDRLPGKLSGGERQRVQIARALSVDPRLLICDECISGLDIPIQARILELLQRLVSGHNLSIIFISHDMNAVRFICDSVAVISGGVIVESGRTEDILKRPRHEITKNLVSSGFVFDE